MLKLQNYGKLQTSSKTRISAGLWPPFRERQWYHTDEIPVDQKPDGIDPGLTISGKGRACGLAYETRTNCNKYTP